MDAKLIHDGVQINVLDGFYVSNGNPTRDAVDFYSTIILRMDEMRRFAAKRLCPLYNETWLDEEIGPVDEDGFINRLVNPAIILLDEPGAAVLFFHDSGLFAGHYIEVSIQNGSPSAAGIAG